MTLCLISNSKKHVPTYSKFLLMLTVQVAKSVRILHFSGEFLDTLERWIVGVLDSLVFAHKLGPPRTTAVFAAAF
ncbi:MAG: hypothetical protein JWN70_6223 [Planctomycetaceae bacterium]|nr:hypothetical protein [Planctomycetaceae bacterium]